MEIIDLRSDTLTRPSAGMIQAMCRARIGDDCYGEDTEVRTLQEYCAEFFGKPAALFMPSGIMSNQVALRALTQPGDEVICDASYHINFFESAQSSDLGKVTLNAIDSNNGILTVDSLQAAMESKARWTNVYAVPTLLWIENSISTHAGRVFPLNMLEEVRWWSQAKGMSLFVDGARILNASFAAQVSPCQYASAADALTMCFSKGLGAPFGSVLLGDEEFISRARRFRKWYGGALHQAGHMAAAALFALKHNQDQLREDNQNARLLAEVLRHEERFRLTTAETNMVVFDISLLGANPEEFVRVAFEQGVQLMVWRGNEIRAVTSSNVSERQTIKAGKKLLQIAKNLGAKSFRTCADMSARVRLETDPLLLLPADSERRSQLWLAASGTSELA